MEVRILGDRVLEQRDVGDRVHESAWIGAVDRVPRILNGNRVLEFRNGRWEFGKGRWEAGGLDYHDNFVEPGSLSAEMPADVVRPWVEASSSDEPRPLVVIRSTPVGPITIHPSDYRERLPAYEAGAREVHRLPVIRVWEIEHASRMRAAVALNEQKSGEHTVYLNKLLTKCGVHRLAAWEHELEHVRRGDCFKTEAYDEAMEANCEAAANRAALSVAGVAAARVREQAGGVAINASRCQTCARNGETPCPQGAAVFKAVNRALAPL